MLISGSLSFLKMRILTSFGTFVSTTRAALRLTLLFDFCQSYIIDGQVDTAVDDRRHDPVVGGRVTAMSVQDLHEQVAKLCPEGTPIPSLQWLHLQFWPRRANCAFAKQQKGRLHIKFMTTVLKSPHRCTLCICTLPLPKRNCPFAIENSLHKGKHVSWGRIHFGLYLNSATATQLLISTLLFLQYRRLIYRTLKQ